MASGGASARLGRRALTIYCIGLLVVRRPRDLSYEGACLIMTKASGHYLVSREIESSAVISVRRQDDDLTQGTMGLLLAVYAI